MAQIHLSGHFAPHTAINAATADTGAPNAAEDTIYITDRGTEYTDRVRCYVSYTGSPSAGNLVIHGYDGTTFYRGVTTALAPGNGNQFIDLTVGKGTRFALELSGLTFTTSGTVTVKVEQI